MHIPSARNLKDRRRVVRSFKDRARARLPISLGEVGDVERYQVATLGAAVVGADSKHCREVLSRLRSLASSLADAQLADIAVEVMSFGGAGRGVQGGIEQALDDSARDWDDDTEVDDRSEEW